MDVHTKLTIALFAGLALTGCTAPQNDRMTIGQSVQLETFYPPAFAVAPEGGAVLPEQQPTLEAVVRSNWEPTLFLVPVDGTAHRPLYRQNLYLTDATVRQRREYPTPISALDLTGGSEQAQQLEALANHGLSVVDTALLIPGLVVFPPWSLRWSPNIAWERYWHPEVTPAVQQIEAPLLVEPPVPPVPPTAPATPPPAAPATPVPQG